jgi:NAD kinase
MNPVQEAIQAGKTRGIYLLPIKRSSNFTVPRQLVVGVNPDPARWDGVLLPFQVKDLEKIIPEVFQGQRKTTTVTMAKGELTDGQTLYAVNDFFIGAKTHVSAR